jgi:hypothetical protein
MAEGRLIRVTNSGTTPPSVAYIVAEPDKAKALAIILSNVAIPGSNVQDLGRVSEPLIAALKLAAGEFSPVNGPQK